MWESWAAQSPGVYDLTLNHSSSQKPVFDYSFIFQLDSIVVWWQYKWVLVEQDRVFDSELESKLLPQTGLVF